MPRIHIPKKLRSIIYYRCLCEHCDVFGSWRQVCFDGPSLDRHEFMFRISPITMCTKSVIIHTNQGILSNKKHLKNGARVVVCCANSKAENHELMRRVVLNDAQQIDLLDFLNDDMYKIS